MRLALWASAAYAGRLAVADVAATALCEFDHVGGDIDRLALWQELGERAVLVALPRPGATSGMPHAGADLLAAATQAGECVFVPGLGGALVPRTGRFGPVGDEGTSVTWTAYEAGPLPVHRLEALDLGDVELQLRRQLAEGTQELAAMENGAWAGARAREDAERCLELRRSALPDGLPLRALRVLDLAAQVAMIVELGMSRSATPSTPSPPLGAGSCWHGSRRPPPTRSPRPRTSRA